MRRSIGTLVLTILVGGPISLPCMAADTWEEQRDRLKKLIDKQVDSEVNRRINPRTIAKALGIEEWPVPEPAMTVEEVEEKAEVMGRDKALAQFPVSMEDDIKTDAEKKYRMYDVGEKVEFMIRKGLGTNPKIRGVFLGANPQKVKVGHRYIIKGDMEEEDLAHFYEDTHEELKGRYIAARLRVLDAQRDSFEEDYTRKFRSELYKKANFIVYKRRWVPKKKLLEMAVEYTKDKERKKVLPTVEQQTYTENGYVFKDGQWVPRSVADALEAKLKKLLASQEDEGTNPPPEDGGEGEPGGEGQGGSEAPMDGEEPMDNEGATPTPEQENMYGDDEGV